MKWIFYKRSLSLVGDVNLARLPPNFLFQHAHFSYCALDYLKRSPPRSVTKFLSVYHSRFKIGYLYGTFYHADVTFSNRNNNFSDILPKRKMPTINNLPSIIRTLYWHPVIVSQQRLVFLFLSHMHSQSLSSSSQQPQHLAYEITL